MNHIGIDLHKTSGQVCTMTEDGELIERHIAANDEVSARRDRKVDVRLVAFVAGVAESLRDAPDEHGELP